MKDKCENKNHCCSGNYICPTCHQNGEKIYISKVDPTIKRTLDSLVCIGCGKKLNICRQSCDWHKAPQPPDKEEVKIVSAKDTPKCHHGLPMIVCGADCCMAFPPSCSPAPKEEKCIKHGVVHKNGGYDSCYYKNKEIVPKPPAEDSVIEPEDYKHFKAAIYIAGFEEGKKTAFAEIEKFVEEKKKDKVQVPAACPDKMPGCLVYHFGYEETPEIKAYNQALSDILSFIKDKQNKTE